MLEQAVAGFTAEKVSSRCGIPTENIRTLARNLAAAKHAVVYGRVGTCTQEYGTLCSWLIDVQNILTGHFDELGGAMFPKAAALQSNTFPAPGGKPGSGKGVVTGRRKSRVLGKRAGSSSRKNPLQPGSCFGRAYCEYHTRRSASDICDGSSPKLGVSGISSRTNSPCGGAA